MGLHPKSDEFIDGMCAAARIAAEQWHAIDYVVNEKFHAELIASEIVKRAGDFQLEIYRKEIEDGKAKCRAKDLPRNAGTGV